AYEQIERQKKDFLRLGVLGEWDNPYLTMNYSNEADELRVLAQIMKKGFVFPGLKPANWCFDCRSALAEAEVEYADRTDPSIYVACPAAVKDALAKPSDTARIEDGAIVIGTTTPWTIPANQALNVHPDHEYALINLDTPQEFGRQLILAKELVEPTLEELGIQGQVIATTSGKG